MMQENLLKEYGLYINGEWRSASDGATFSSTDPATGEHLAVCAEATKVDVDNAVKAAQKAFETWKDTTAQQRAEILNKIADIIDANAVHLAKVESMDNGKPFRETSGIFQCLPIISVILPLRSERRKVLRPCWIIIR